MYPKLRFLKLMLRVVSRLPQPTASVGHRTDLARHALHERTTKERPDSPVLCEVISGDRRRYRTAAKGWTKRFLNVCTVGECQRAIVHCYRSAFLWWQSIVQPMTAILAWRDFQREF